MNQVCIYKFQLIDASLVDPRLATSKAINRSLLDRCQHIPRAAGNPVKDASGWDAHQGKEFGHLRMLIPFRRGCKRRSVR
jgi:hypothetical protein